MSPSGKALVSGTSIRGFESLHPSQYFCPCYLNLAEWDARTKGFFAGLSAYSILFNDRYVLLIFDLYLF